MDFLEIVEKKAINTNKARTSGAIDIYPDFKVCKSKDLMVRGHSFYAIWDSEQNSWLTDEMEVVRLVDQELFNYRDRILGNQDYVTVKTLASYSTGVWNQWTKFIKSMPDNYHPIDNKILFANDKITKTSYSTHNLSYNLEKGSTKAYDRLMSVLYDDEERQKLEWSVGAVLTGDSKKIQKFCVLYGEAGSGKSTFLNILQKLVDGYYIAFNAKALVGNNNVFGTEVFKNNPLVAIQHDGDLSKIDDNSTLNSIISHEQVVINEKHKSQYSMPINCFLFMGTNKPVKITDTKSGILRRLIDVRPSGRHLSPKEYDQVINEIDFELGAIAYKCIDIYNSLGSKFYNAYRPKDMMFETNVVFNFVEEYYFYFLNDVDFIQLKDVYILYKEFCQNNGGGFILPRHAFREELKAYFADYVEQKRIDGKAYRSVYWNFKKEVIDNNQAILNVEPEKINKLDLSETVSIFDKEFSESQAQYANDNGVPYLSWKNCNTKLFDLNTSKLHYVRLPVNHIVIDFDLKNSNGEKDREKNLEEAGKWPETYAEFSKSGSGIHLHYIYDGDPNQLSRIYSNGIEIKVFSGKSSLRRQLTFCNNLPIAHISTGLPLKEKGDYQMMDNKAIKTERALRDLILRNINKEIHPATRPSIDFIKKILDDAYNSGLVYDLNDMRNQVLIFAMNSTNNSDYCINLVPKMKFSSEKESNPSNNYKIEDLVFFDVEVFPNLFIVVYKLAGDNHNPVTLINPTPEEIGELFKFKLIGFNNRRYDNHILYARYIGYTNEQLFKLSSKIVNSDGSNSTSLFREAYNLSYSDVYDFSNKKQGLKKFGIELGLHHQEFAFPWDQPVPEDKWDMAAEYCANDVYITEATFNDRKADWAARLILAELTGGTPNNSTNQLVTKLIFGDNKNPELVYTDLSETFPGYEWKQLDDGKFHNMYRGDDVGLGGYVYAEPGIYSNVVLLDVASMHPTSLIMMNYFGKYTKNYENIKNARIAIKHGDKEFLGKVFDGMLLKYMADDSIMDDLAYALKIALNSTYGLTSARFENIMKHPKNVNNIVALRGALFMRTLQDEVKSRGYTVAHIKTDSIKIVEADDDIIKFCKEFAGFYGYEFEHEATYQKFCLVNDAVYIAKYDWTKKKDDIGKWTATGAQFQHPYVFKKLFTKEIIDFKDLCEVKAVTGDSSLYLDLNENLSENQHDYKFVGRTGEFSPIKDGYGGGILYRVKDNKYYAVTGTKGYRWLESEVIHSLHHEDHINLDYFNSLVDEAIDTINKFGDFEAFAV